ncbi:hypothetical protein QAD02_011685 [Eretmocerus hayati]|uniref:Uncharacterized protein n=1 Tax=Eretmocerus hayati TaxID=131215 RepID=A0ACC2NXU4_9HYME|nr:hypothetical protein QAD02_011685 [Eretmocerus hayati]
MSKFTYGLIVNSRGQTTLKRIARMIAGEVKEMMHISSKTCSAFLYAPKKLGGLGIVCQAESVTIAALCNGRKAQMSTDPVTAQVARSEKVVNQLTIYARQVNLAPAATLAKIDLMKETLKQNHAERWAAQELQGQGGKEFQSKWCNDRLRRPLLKHSRFGEAIKMRTNTLPTKVSMYRASGRTDGDVSCRRCHVRSQTLGHVLGECISTKACKIYRHDEVKNLIAARSAMRNQVFVEQSFRSRTGALLRPDPVVKNEDRAYIVDVTIRFEREENLKRGAIEKLNKYRQLITTVKQELNVSLVKVLPVVLGSRGAIPLKTEKNLKLLNIRNSDMLTISMIALRSSLEMFAKFQDYG